MSEFVLDNSKTTWTIYEQDNIKKEIFELVDKYYESRLKKSHLKLEIMYQFLVKSLTAKMLKI